VDKSAFSDVVFLEPPSRIGLSATRAACKDFDINIDKHLEVHLLGSWVDGASELALLKKQLDDIETFLREVKAPTMLGCVYSLVDYA